MTKPFKLRSHSAVKKSGFKMMGSSPMKQVPTSPSPGSGSEFTPYAENPLDPSKTFSAQFWAQTRKDIEKEKIDALEKAKNQKETQALEDFYKQYQEKGGIEKYIQDQKITDLQKKVDELTQRGQEEQGGQGGQGEEIVGYDEQGQPIYGRKAAPPPDVEVVPQPGIEAENAIFQLISDKIGKSVDYVKNLSQEKLDALKSRFIPPGFME